MINLHNNLSTMSTQHILVIPFHGHGHLFPSIELCKRLSSSLHYKITLIIPSSLSSSLPHHHPLFQVSLLPQQPPPPALPDSNPPHHPHHHDHFNMMIQPFTDLLSEHFNGPDPPNCAIIDVMIPWAHQPCQQFNIPTISFFTSSACSASVEFALEKLSPDNLTAGDLLSGLPEFIRMSLTDMTHWAPPPPHHHPQLEPMSGAPPGPPPPPRSGPGRQPSWVSQTESSIALMINTCDDLERPFVDYLRKEVKKPIFCVGPLLPEEFSTTVGSTVQDSAMRSKRDQSTYSEEDINEWLDTKPRGSVIYVSFGSEVGPTKDELADLAVALDECNRPFIWVIQSGPNQHGPKPGRGSHGPPTSTNMDMDLDLDGFVERVKGRGLILRGWAPQLLILSHSSTGGFITHGGWNSTLEAILSGVPLLTWPIRGDQHYNARLIMEHFKVGLIIKGDDNNQIEGLKKDDILQGIEKLMDDENIRKHATNLLANMFEHELSGSYKASLDAFNSFMNITRRSEQ